MLVVVSSAADGLGFDWRALFSPLFATRHSAAGSTGTLSSAAEFTVRDNGQFSSFLNDSSDDEDPANTHRQAQHQQSAPAPTTAKGSVQNSFFNDSSDDDEPEAAAGTVASQSSTAGNNFFADDSDSDSGGPAPATMSTTAPANSFFEDDDSSDDASPKASAPPTVSDLYADDSDSEGDILST